MGKRKRENGEKDTNLPSSKAARPVSSDTAANTSTKHTTSNTADTVLQLVAGSYERALHGVVAYVPTTADVGSATFADSFLFNAHTSSVRCLALSPASDAQKVFLASGGTDERINIYSLTTVPPPRPQSTPTNGTKPTKHAALNALSRPAATSAANREVGTLNHHSATVTSLSFPTRTKMLSAAADNTIAVLRTRDWEVLSSLRAPVPKPMGRPSGDTAAPGEVPAGINDIAVHPSLKLMLTVGRGEKCMRLWNLVTGKKAGVLQFDRSLLAQVGEGKYSSGEGRRALWDQEGEQYAILFERGACVFGLDSKPKAVIRPEPRTKLHQIQYLPGSSSNILVLSTEDGRLLFYDTRSATSNADNGVDASTSEHEIPVCTAIAQLGGREQSVPTRIKDFAILSTQHDGSAIGVNGNTERSHLAVTACSDGAIQIWRFELPGVPVPPSFSDGAPNGQSGDDANLSKPRQIGALVGAYETGHRITCMSAFVMDGIPSASSLEDDILNGQVNAISSSSEGSSDESE